MPFPGFLSLHAGLRSRLGARGLSGALPANCGKVIKGLKFACKAIDIQTLSTPLNVTEKIKAASFQSFRLKMEELANM